MTNADWTVSLGILWRSHRKSEEGKRHERSRKQELIRNILVELSKGNGDAFFGTMADNVRFTVIGTTKFSGTYNGKQELAANSSVP
jgi:hypothetical protein